MHSNSAQGLKGLNQGTSAADNIVLVLDKSKPRNSWPARILEVYPNRHDGLVRSIKLKRSTSMALRSVDKIVLLETAVPPSMD